MAEYIERNILMKVIRLKIPLLWRLIDPVIKIVPVADVAYVQHGRWIEESDGGTRCSVCNKRVRDATGGRDDPVNLSKMPYCPKCGAKMDLDGGIKNDRS